MIAMAKKKPRPFDVILVWKFSRFARNREDSIVYKSMLKKQCGIEVISISEPVGDDKVSIITEAVIEAMDEYYSLNLSEEVRRGMQKKFETGGVVSQAPFGYRVENGQYTPDPKTAPLVAEIFDLFLSGHGYIEIARMMNERGVRTKYGNLWENRTVEYLIRNPVYAGKLRFSKKGRIRRDYGNENMQVVDGKHQPIVSQELFEAAPAPRLSAQGNAPVPWPHRRENTNTCCADSPSAPTVAARCRPAPEKWCSASAIRTANAMYRTTSRFPLLICSRFKLQGSIWNPAASA